ncbi:MAG: molybdopterin molybdotransferase MoeA [Alphaproteobacteria bacterium]|nr:molybdopterin molybdotransferase MoeA [Alphaproteobacteria bacterium]
MISVAEARERIVSALAPVGTESVGLAAAAGRVLAAPVIAQVTQPPVAVSAMDGWALRAADARVGARLKAIGESAAGTAFPGTVGAGETVRIFTGAPVPSGADAILIQENAKREGEAVVVQDAVKPGLHVREAGLDFKTGEVGLAPPRLLTARDIGFAAAMNVPWLTVRRRPRIALLATGDELVKPGERVGPSQILSSNSYALAAVVAGAGGEAIDLGIAPDDRDGLAAMVAGARGADLLITIGGASVGDRDLVRSVLGEKGLALDFWQIAMRPGKPLLFGRLGEVPLLGLPGNPVSALVCALVFLRPAIGKLLGVELPLPTVRAVLGADLPANDQRQDYLRATLSRDPDGRDLVSPFARQDSSNLARLARADALIIRPPHAAALEKGQKVEIVPLVGVMGY